MKTIEKMEISDLKNICQARLEKLFSQYLNEGDHPASYLQKAVIYSVLNGGKRLRPLLVYITGHALGASFENCDAAACAIELIHSYSLIHDDLPAMDNSDLRRGKATCHKAFNEATAILAGDALQPLAFEILANHPCALSDNQRLAMIKQLSHASGFNGMVAGQMLDLENTDNLEKMYRLKTGALLSASTQLGAIAANNKDPLIFKSLQLFADHLGLAFQIQDDLLDFENCDMTGKPQGLDFANNKITYPVVFGIEKTKQKISALFTNACENLILLGERNHLLKEFAEALMQRKY